MKKIFLLFSLFSVISYSNAQTVFRFDFSGYIGTPPPLSSSVGSAILTHNGLSGFFEDACTGQGFAANGWDSGDYIQIRTSTVGFIGPYTFGFDYRMSDIDLGNFDIQVSTNGTNFTSIGNLNAVNPSAGCNAYNPITLNNSYDNQANLYLRLSKSNNAATGLNRLRLDNINLQASAFPVEISYFQTEASDFQKVNIRWETISEINSDYFSVERSRDALNYKSIGSIEAAGSSNTRRKYSFMDETALFGTNYYRLIQIDKDGTRQIFRPQAVVIEDIYIPFGVFPNPLISKSFCVKVEDTDEAYLELFDANQESISLKINKLTQTVLEITPSQTLNIGIYLLEVRTLGNLRKHKILILR